MKARIHIRAEGGRAVNHGLRHKADLSQAFILIRTSMSTDINVSLE